jgi:hypothetical protein
MAPTESTERIASFEEFWPVYVRAHANKWNRRLHFAGTTAAVVTAGLGLLTLRPSLLLLAPVVGYGPAWIGHYFVEGNRPATFDYPRWSLQADFVMWAKMLQGTMDAEVERAMATTETDHADTPSEAPTVDFGQAAAN